VPRVDVLLRVKGELVPVGFAIRILNLSRTGFALISEARFRAGDRIDVRLSSKRGPCVQVAATATHTRPLATSRGLFVTGFAFRPLSSAVVPDEAVSALLAAVAPAGFRF
jgi:hypothetical protein